MRNSAGATVLVVTLLASSVASAQAAVTYEGEFPTSTADDRIRLTFVKNNGKRYLEFFDAQSVPATCEGEDTSVGTLRFLNPPLGRVRDRHFKYVEGSREADGFLKLVGDLKRNGRAVGVFRYRADFGGPYGVCDTGLVDWVAFK